jgi:serine/threonine protein kinase
MGRVYRARHLGLGRIVALKLLLHEADEKLLARFREETRAVARLQHPNIAQLYETGSANGRPYFAQEFLDGGSLAQALAGKPQLPRAAADLLEVIARAIHYSHSEGILHRDLKPGNILLARKSDVRSAKADTQAKAGEPASGSDIQFHISDFIPKVADFGLAKMMVTYDAVTKIDSGGALTHTGEILGTPSYMPPEQASGVVTKIGPTADVYALGAMFYELLTGRPPFQSSDPIQTLMLVLTRDPVPPRSLLPDIPRDLETICLKCLEKSPK